MSTRNVCHQTSSSTTKQFHIHKNTNNKDICNTSDVLEHKAKDYMILTSNTEATENKVQFFNFAYRVKGFQCHSNNSLQLLELKEKNNNKTIHVF